MGCHPKPIDELIFFKMVKTTNQSLLDLEWMEQRLLHHRIGLQEHRETPETRCHFCPWNTGVSSVWFPWNQFKDSFNRLKLTIHGFNPTCFMVEVPTIHCSRVKVLLFFMVKVPKTAIQHWNPAFWMVKSNHPFSPQTNRKIEGSGPFAGLRMASKEERMGRGCAARGGWLHQQKQEYTNECVWIIVIMGM